MTLVWFLLPLLYFLVHDLKGKNELKVSIPFLLFLIIISGMRDWTKMDNDSYNYYTWFEYGESYLLGEGVERAYGLMNIFLINHNLSFQWVLMIMSIISLLAVFFAFRNLKLNSALGLLIWVLLTYYFYSFNAMRQLTADSILLLAFTFLYKRKLLPFFATVLCATLFHKTTIVALVLVVFYFKNFKISEKLFAITLISTLILGTTTVARSIAGYLASFSDKYAVSDVYGYIDTISVSKIAMTAFYIYLYHHANKDNVLFKIVFVGIAAFNFLAFSVGTMRLAYTFLVCQTLLLTNHELEDRYECKRKQITYLTIGYLVFVYYYFLNSNISDVLNYQMSPFSNLFKV